jgi:hypothetical protein
MASQVLRICNLKPAEIKISQSQEEKKDLDNKEDKKEDKLSFLYYNFSQSLAKDRKTSMSYYHLFISSPVLEHCTPPPDFLLIFA